MSSWERVWNDSTAYGITEYCPNIPIGIGTWDGVFYQIHGMLVGAGFIPSGMSRWIGCGIFP